MQEMKEEQEKREGHTYWQWILALLVNMTLFTYGLDVGWTSPMVKVLQSEQSPAGEPLSDITVSWIASIVCLAAVFAVFIYSYIAERFGSKVSVIAIATPQAISWLIRLCFVSGPWLITSRFISGIAAGGCFNAVVMYVKEISQDSVRGVLGSMLVLVQNIGVLLMYIMGAYLDYNMVTWIVACIPVINGILLFQAPQSPAFLVKQGKIDEAIATVAFLRGLNRDHKTVMSEVEFMKNEDDYYKSQPNLSLITIVKNLIWRRGLIVSTVIIMVQGMNGAFAVTTYASSILTSTGVKFNVSAETLTLSIPIILIFGSIVFTICADRIGRRTHSIIMLSIAACSNLGIGVSMLMKLYGGTVPNWLPILCMMTSVWSYSGGVAALPYIIMAEMFSFQTRAKVLGMTITLAWLASFIQLIGYIPLSNAAGLHTTFFIFAGVNTFGIIFTLLFLPETRGKSVEQIEEDLAIRIGLDKVDKNMT
ncbi:facilitated trehalose transporter Tret1-like [Epargyreus clarus]|uniref:facilitated trehalose transporter Tret1-like n=1 Tax=Epargyreus clarus TaxID=520877 RepID=UPI003C307C1D